MDPWNYGLGCQKTVQEISIDRLQQALHAALPGGHVDIPLAQQEGWVLTLETMQWLIPGNTATCMEKETKVE